MQSLVPGVTSLHEHWGQQKCDCSADRSVLQRQQVRHRPGSTGKSFLQVGVQQEDAQMCWVCPTRLFQLRQSRCGFKYPGALLNSLPNSLHNASTPHLSPVPHPGTKSRFSPSFLEQLFNQAFAISMAVSCKALQHILFQMVHRKPILAVTKCSELTTTFYCSLAPDWFFLMSWLWLFLSDKPGKQQISLELSCTKQTRFAYWCMLLDHLKCSKSQQFSWIGLAFSFDWNSQFKTLAELICWRFLSFPVNLNEVRYVNVRILQAVIFAISK